jgi:hypothetical protein
LFISASHTTTSGAEKYPYSPFAYHSRLLNIALATDTASVEESITDESIVQLGYAKPHYDNVGMVSKYIPSFTDPAESLPQSSGSAVYIGDGLCLTAAHTFFGKKNKFSVCFEIKGKKTKEYSIERIIIHPEYPENKEFDIAMLVLNQNVDKLDGLKPYYEFTENPYFVEDELYPLTHTGYGDKLFCNDWLRFSDQKRRGLRRYTRNCDIRKSNFGLYSTPYKGFNRKEDPRPLFPFEARSRSGVSGGAVIHAIGLVSIHEGLKWAKSTYLGNIGTFFLKCLRVPCTIINDCFFPSFFFNETRLRNFTK